MTVDEAVEVVADQVTSVALQEVIDNGLCDAYIDAELSAGHSAALRDRLVARAAKGPSPTVLSAALRLLVA